MIKLAVVGNSAIDAVAALYNLAEMYAQSLRDFHEVSQSRWIVPMRCAENAPAAELHVKILDGVAGLMLCDAGTLRAAIAKATAQSEGSSEIVDPLEFDLSPYRPTPTIVEAAPALYAGHRIAEIGRGDAADIELQNADDCLRATAADAERNKSKTICFVTGCSGGWQDASWS